MTTVRVTLVMHLETDKAQPLSNDQTTWAIEDTESAIRNRLMGEGFLPNDVLLESYTIQSEAH